MMAELVAPLTSVPSGVVVCTHTHTQRHLYQDISIKMADVEKFSAATSIDIMENFFIEAFLCVITIK